MTKVLSTNNLTKKYKDQTANDNITINVNQGDVYALIGKNGAGKTTFMKMISGLIKPTSGTFSLWDTKDCSEFPSKYNQRIGTLIEAPGLLMNLNAFDNIKAKCICYGKSLDSEYINSILNLVDLKNASKKKIKEYSLGMKQRLGIALALVGGPDLIILDEPINGLDPEGIIFIREMILDLKNKGKTFIISSHILEELSKIATKYGFINNGKLIREITQEELNNKCVKLGISLEEYYVNLIREK